MKNQRKKKKASKAYRWFCGEVLLNIRKILHEIVQQLRSKRLFSKKFKKEKKTNICLDSKGRTPSCRRPTLLSAASVVIDCARGAQEGSLLDSSCVMVPASLLDCCFFYRACHGPTCVR